MPVAEPLFNRPARATAMPTAPFSNTDSYWLQWSVGTTSLWGRATMEQDNCQKEGWCMYDATDDLYLILTAEVLLILFRDDLKWKWITSFNDRLYPMFSSWGRFIWCACTWFKSFTPIWQSWNRSSWASRQVLWSTSSMVEHVKQILNELKLPHRILRLLWRRYGFASALTYDFEVFSTAQDRWLEISSPSKPSI
jgi:seryl-tRNA synthetase